MSPFHWNFFAILKEKSHYHPACHQYHFHALQVALCSWKILDSLDRFTNRHDDMPLRPAGKLKVTSLVKPLSMLRLITFNLTCPNTLYKPQHTLQARGHPPTAIMHPGEKVVRSKVYTRRKFGVVWAKKHVSFFSAKLTQPRIKYTKENWKLNEIYEGWKLKGILVIISHRSNRINMSQLSSSSHRVFV